MSDITGKYATARMIDDQRMVDLRRRSADAISHALFDELRHLLPRDIERDVFRELWEAVYRNGTMIISDKEAERLGLERKDREGWTSSERVQMKLDREALMFQMANIPNHSKERSDDRT